MYSNSEITAGIRNGDVTIINWLYKKCFSKFARWIKKNSGSEEDAEDVYQEAMIIVYKQLKTERLVLTCKFTSYLLAICNKLWYKELRIRRTRVIDIFDLRKHNEVVNQNDPLIERKIEIYLSFFADLSPKCQEILKLYLSGVSYDDIMRIMGYEIRQSVKDRTSRCKKRLIETIRNSPEFKELLHELLTFDR